MTCNPLTFVILLTASSTDLAAIRQHIILGEDLFFVSILIVHHAGAGLEKAARAPTRELDAVAGELREAAGRVDNRTVRSACACTQVLHATKRYFDYFETSFNSKGKTDSAPIAMHTLNVQHRSTFGLSSNGFGESRLYE